MENEMGEPVVGAALRSAGVAWVDDGTMTAEGLRVESQEGRVVVATIDLGPGTRFGQSRGDRWIDVDGTLPDQLASILQGAGVERVLSHPATDGSGLTVTETEDLEGRTRIRLR